MFTEQCKRRGIKLEELDTGWVPQHKIGEETDDEIIEDEELDDEDDFDEDDEEILFSSRPTPPRKEVSTDDSNSEILFKTGKQKANEAEDNSKTPVKVEKPEVSMADLEAMFGPSSAKSDPEPDNKPDNSVSSMYGGTPNRDRINLALKKADVISQNVNVTYDKTSTDLGMAAATTNPGEKPKIKLNIKQKPPV